ncbi:B2 protein [Dichanthelium oligosanthes]|uniref:B2 protein n=1 Tax=Dichanthelium oligosanthes TaxID=888268 RepID=A0A1E5UQZ8_9POAL|nr:B2 protein [Dichanthelium oligosanthes]
MEGYDREFWQFSDQLRLQTAAFSGLSLGDSIWSPAGDRRNAQPDAGLFASPSPADGAALEAAKNNSVVSHLNDGGPGLIGSGKRAFGASKADRYNNLPTEKAASYNNNNSIGGGYGAKNNINNNGLAFNKMGSYGYNSNNSNGNSGEVKSYFNKSAGRPANNNSHHGGGGGKKQGGAEYGKKKHAKNEGGNSNNATAADKRFKTLPASEALPRGEAVGGYIFVCNNDTMDENLRRELFGLPSRYRDSVRAIRPGLPLFLYNYSTHQLHGIFEAASFGGTNIDPTAWEDKKCPGESRFPAQVRVATRKVYDPLEEDAFRPILHHYDGPKFRLELSVTEALALLDIFAEKNDA